MSTQRDELAAALNDALANFYEPFDWHEATRIAARILAAGYGKLPEPIDPDKATIINGWLVVEYGCCTCGGGDSASGYHHESGCGYEPLMNITDILAATGYTLTEGVTP